MALRPDRRFKPAFKETACQARFSHTLKYWTVVQTQGTSKPVMRVVRDCFMNIGQGQRIHLNITADRTE